MDADRATVYFDGLCQPVNPGGYGCGGYYIPPQPALRLEHACQGGRCYGKGPEMTNNIAEYHAAIDALTALAALDYRGPVDLYGDSQLVIQQYRRAWRCNQPHLRRLLVQLDAAASEFERVDLLWVPRALNNSADVLSRRAYDRAVAADASVGTPA